MEGDEMIDLWIKADLHILMTIANRALNVLVMKSPRVLEMSLVVDYLLQGELV